MNKSWTLEQEQELIDMRYAELSWTEISQKIGKSADTCRKKHTQLMQEYQSPKFWEKVRYLQEKGIVE